jgi:hypothetical protein
MLATWVAVTALFTVVFFTHNYILKGVFEEASREKRAHHSVTD